jgi:threonine dehydrogenase-like Zn-dependent dehydrogenase
MKAACWQGIHKVGIEQVPDPHVINPRDAVIKVRKAAICGSDLHLYDGYVPSMMRGDILGHEFMGEVVELGSNVTNLSVGDRVVVPFPISCGNCYFCEQEMFSLCENSNPNAKLAEKFWGHSPCGIFGYSHLLGGYAGGQAEYVRVPFADVGPLKVPDSLSDEQVLFLSDILPTGYMAAENCNIQEGDTVAVWGCGPVGLFAIASAKLLGAGRVIGIDRFPERLERARRAGAETINYEESDTLESLQEMTGGRGPDACIDAVGMEAHVHGPQYAYDKVKQVLRMETERPIVLREAIQACRKGGTVSVPGVYGGIADKIPLGAIVNKALTIKSGQTHVQHYMKPLLGMIENGQIDPTFIISHRIGLDEVPEAFRMFRNKEDECIKFVVNVAS